MEQMQELIHKIEVGGGLRVVRVSLVLLTVLLLIFLYNWRAFKNMGTQEAMDTAQLGRNIAQGKGYTTLFVRPFSLFLIKRHNLARHGSGMADAAQLKGMHPDLANPPVYPVVLAGLMKVLHFNYDASVTKRFWSSGGKFWRYQPDFFIGFFNQVLFLGVLALVFLLARRLFDKNVAWLSTLLLLGTEQLWRFCVSGLSTMLLLLIFMGLIWCLVWLEQEAREPRSGPAMLLVLAVLAGGLAGLGGLTRYSFGLVILPVLLFLVLFGGPKRLVLGSLALLAFALVMGPWVARNYSVSGTPFGTAGYAMVETTGYFPDNHLPRSLEPEFTHLALAGFWVKLIVNLRQIVQNDLPKLGGTWAAAFFLVGLLVGYRNPAVARLRYFAVGCLLLLILAQALGRTQLSEASPEINSENLLVLLVPLVVIYGVSLFYLLLDQLHLPFRELRYIGIGAFGVLACLPMILVFLPPKTIPIVYPPYHPPTIQQNAGWAAETELTMSDIPWAVAWYGQSQCVWLTLDAGTDFLTINDYQKPIQVLYLSPLTVDGRFLSDWILSGEEGWGNLMFSALPFNRPRPSASQASERPPWPKPIDVVLRNPSGLADRFPLHWWQAGWPGQFLLTAREQRPKAL